MVSSYKFIQKLWILHKEIYYKITHETEDDADKDFEKFTNQLIVKFTNNLEKFNYNVIIANMYETYNYLISFIKNKKNIKNLRKNYKKILICFSPVIPHFSNECLSQLNLTSEISWPEYKQNLLEDINVNFVIQINGKKRLIINIKKGINEEDLLKIVKKDERMKKYLNKKEIKKTIFVKDRLINFLLNE